MSTIRHGFAFDEPTYASKLRRPRSLDLGEEVEERGKLPIGIKGSSVENESVAGSI
jgi:hypothetical protein